jgi:hypothetical protein
MRWLRLLVSLIAAPLIYGVLCIPLLAWWIGLFPHHINSLGGTSHVPLVLSIELMQAIILVLCGIAVGFVSGEGRWGTVCLMGATADMLLIGVSVQTQFWESMPIWHHWIFFALIAICLPLGGWISHRVGIGWGEADEGAEGA